MPLFALPITTVSAKHSNPLTLHTSHNPHKRKRSNDPSSSDSEQETNDETPEVASTNPLSLAPSEIVQYRLAGLRLNEELPITRIDGWPHRGFRTGDISPEKKRSGQKKKGKQALKLDVETDIEEGGVEGKIIPKAPKVGPRLRTQHLQVLVAILQKCLMENDIQRAGRAWALLVRAQVGGQGVDIRGAGYWGVGVEVLMRSFEGRGRKGKGKEVLGRDRRRGGEDHEDIPGENREDGNIGGKNLEAWAWGSKEGLERAKEYFERLIIQHPYKRYWHNYVSALDFWPQMVVCEIYGIQQEYTVGMERIRKSGEGDDGDFRGGSQESDFSDSDNGNNVESEVIWRTHEIKKTRRLKRRRDRRWNELDEIRTTALSASQDIARRLDEVMMMPPFSDSHDMLRLRGMLALYMGDLSVPGKPREGNGDLTTEERFLFAERIGDWDKGLGKRREMFELAEEMFERIRNDGGEEVKMPRFEVDDGDE